MPQDLPNLEILKLQMIQNGAVFPLKTIPFDANGLLSSLPVVNKQGYPWKKESAFKKYNSDIKYPKITVVMPTYNQGNFIEESIRSVILQNYPNLEFIIVDGGSTDQTVEIIKKYEPWISYWQSKKDKGQGNAINLGFSIASGDYLGWMNSDDLYNINGLYELAKEIMKSDKDFYYGDAIEISEDGSEKSLWTGNFVVDRYLCMGGLIASHSAFWNKRIHQPIWERMHCNVDGELWLRLVRNRSKKHIHYPIGIYRFQAEAKTQHEKWRKKWREDDILILEKYGNVSLSNRLKDREFRYFQMIYKIFFKSKFKL
jgi:glycosyltransferase involved in cell wall biosynthesis